MNKVRWLVLCLILLTSLAGCEKHGAGFKSYSIGITGCNHNESDFINLNGILYLGAYRSDSIDQDTLSPYDTIKRKNQSVSRDGDAILLEAGTPVYALQDYAPSFRLAVKDGGSVRVYQVSRNPQAQKGSDVLDIMGKVESIGIRQPGDRLDLAAITDTAQIDELVQMVLEAPGGYFVLDNQGVQQVTLSFYLVDGTKVGGFFWLDSGILSPPELQLPI
jgi:hypothetical protein